MSTSAPGDRVAWPVLSARRARRHGHVRQRARDRVGELLFEAGDASYDLFVVLEGEAEVVRPERRARRRSSPHFGPGGFIGELTLLTGQRRYRQPPACSRPGRVLVIEQDEFRRLMSVRPALAETIFSALVARREILRAGQGAQAIQIIGSRYSPEAMSLRSFAEHSRLAHTWIDLEDADDVDALLASMGLRPQDTPVVITPTGCCAAPRPRRSPSSSG